MIIKPFMVIFNSYYKLQIWRHYLVNRLEVSGGEIRDSSSDNSGGGSDLGLRGLDMIYNLHHAIDESLKVLESNFDKS